MNARDFGIRDFESKKKIFTDRINEENVQIGLESHTGGGELLIDKL